MFPAYGYILYLSLVSYVIIANNHTLQGINKVAVLVAPAEVFFKLPAFYDDEAVKP